MTNPIALDVAVVGGSIGGLTAALVLRDIGCAVTVYERSPAPLSGFGAGIVVQEPTVRYLIERLGTPLEAISVAASRLQYLGPDGSVSFERPSPYRFTAWNAIYTALLDELGLEHVRFGHTFVGMDERADALTLHFENGAQIQTQLGVFADGVTSSARAQLMPDVQPVYSGYVGWRGTVTESLLSTQTFEALSDAITYGLIPDSHIVAYQIPSIKGSLSEGERLVNFVWYRNVAEGSDLDDLMTDRDGALRPLSLHPGAVQDRHVDAIRQTAEAALPRQLAEMVVRTPQPFVQKIVDVESPSMVFGRACLIGDAAFTARPHAAAGTAKAAENAWTLGQSLVAHQGDLSAALTAWQAGQLALGHNLVTRARQIGERSQLFGTWVPGDPALRFGLYGPGS